MRFDTSYYSNSTCGICNSIDTTLVVKGVKDPYLMIKRSFSIFQCKNCNTYFTNPKIKDKDQSFLYGDQYFSPSNKLSYFEKIYRFHQFDYDFKIYKDLVSKKESILDYGCGDGSRIEFLHKKGYRNTFGIDMYDSFAANIDKDKFYKAINPVDYSAKKKFKVVTLYHVLEHITNPDNELAFIKNNLLSNNGYLVIQVPNAGSRQFQKYGARWFGLDVPRHLWHFTKESLVYLLEKNGFEIKKVNSKNSILHPTTALSTIYGFDIRNEWKKRSSKLNIYSKFLLYTLLSTPNSIRENLLDQNALINVVAEKRFEKRSVSIM